MDKMLPTLCLLCQLDTIFLSDNARDYVILWTITPRGPHCQVIAFKTSKHKSAANQFYLKVNWYISKVAILKVCIFLSKYAKVIEYYMHVSILTLSPIMVKDCRFSLSIIINANLINQLQTKMLRQFQRRSAALCPRFADVMTSRAWETSQTGCPPVLLCVRHKSHRSRSVRPVLLVGTLS